MKSGERRRAAFRRVLSSADLFGDGAMSHNAGVKICWRILASPNLSMYATRTVFYCMLLYATVCFCMLLYAAMLSLRWFLHDLNVPCFVCGCIAICVRQERQKHCPLIIWKTYQTSTDLKSHAGDAWKVLKTYLEACTSSSAAEGSRLRREGRDNRVGPQWDVLDLCIPVHIFDLSWAHRMQEFNAHLTYQIYYESK